MRAYVRFVVSYRFVVLAVLAAITGLGGWALGEAVIATSIDNLFLGESEAYAEYQKKTDDFGNDEHILVAIVEPAMLTAEPLARLEAAVAEIEAMEDVARVSSILDAQHISADGADIVIEGYTDQLLESPEDGAAIVGELMDDPFVGGLLVSKDGTAWTVGIELAPDPHRSAEVYPGLLRDIAAAFTGHGFEEGTLEWAGLISTLGVLVDETYFSLSRVLPFVIGVLLLVAYLMFRRLWPVAITGLVSLLSIVWTMGFAVFVFRDVNILMALSPIFVGIIAFSDVVHLVSSYLIELEGTDDKGRAIEEAGTHVGRACMYTSLTTLIGFSSMGLVPAPAFRQLGLVLGVGVASALFIAVTLTPIIFSLMRRPKPWRKGATSLVQGLLDRLLGAMDRLAARRPWHVVAGFVVITAVAVVGITQLHFDTAFSARFAEDHPLRQDLAFFEEQLDGTTIIDVFVDAGAPDGILDPALFGKIASFEAAIEGLDGVSGVLSVVDLVRSIHDELLPDEAGTLPDTEAALAQHLLLFEMAGGEELERLVDFERALTKLTVRIHAQGFIETATVGTAIEALAASYVGDAATVEVTGLMFLLGDWLDTIITSQESALLFAFLTIFVMMAVGLRSVRAGLWSMIPNAIPLLLLGGYLGFFRDAVDSDVFAVGMVAIGIAVDDTIHFLMRYKDSLARSATRAEAVTASFNYSGRAIVITTVIIVLGFAPCASADLLTTNMMGTLLPGTLALALLGDLLLLPALVHLGVFPMTPGKPRGASDHT